MENQVAEAEIQVTDQGNRCYLLPTPGALQQLWVFARTIESNIFGSIGF